MKRLAIIGLIVLSGLIATGCEKKFGVKDVSPAVGTLGGGEPIVIRGSGFNPTLGIAVYFGHMKADNVVVSSTDKLMVTTPSSAEPKVVDIRIETDDGKMYKISDAFRYVEKGAMDIRDLGKRKSLREKPE